MTQWGYYPYDFPYFTGADDDAAVDAEAAAATPAVVAPVVAPIVAPVVDPTAVIDVDAAAAAAAAAQQQALAAQQALLAQQQAAQLAQQAAVLQVSPLPVVRRHHIWRSLVTGRTIRTLIGTPRDHQMHRLALLGRVVRVAGGTAVGAAGELYFQVVHPDGAALRWQDGSVQGDHPPMPYGTVFQGTLRSHDLVEVSLPGFVGWVNVYELNQLGATRTGEDLAGAAMPPDSLPFPGPTPMPQFPCPTDMVWNPVTHQCEHADWHTAYGVGVDTWGPLAPTCPPNMQWNPGTLQCISNIPPPPAPLPTHAAGWDGWWGGGGWGQWGFPHEQRDQYGELPMFFVGAEAPQEHARAAAEHRERRDEHAHAAEHHPEPHARDAHGREAARHHDRAEHHERERGRHEEARRGGRGGRPGGGRPGAGRFAHPAHGWGRGGFAQRGHGGFSRFYHSHPEWHHVGHPAWRHGVADRWRHHRAGCAQDVGAAGIGAAILGPLGALFGMSAPCLIESISHPEGYTTYRVTPAGEQQGTQLALGQIDANNQFQQQTGQAAPTADDGPMPGSTDAASGAQPPDPGTDQDQQGAAAPAADATAAAQQVPDQTAQADQTAQTQADTTAQAAQQYRAQGYYAGAVDCGPTAYWDDAQKTCVPVSFQPPPTGTPPHCPQGQFWDYLRQACVAAAPPHAAGVHHGGGFHHHHFHPWGYGGDAPDIDLDDLGGGF